MHRIFYFLFFLRIPTRGAGYLKGAPEKPLLVYGDDLLYFPDRVGHWALLGFQAQVV